MRRKIKEFIVRDKNNQSYLLILNQDFLEPDDKDDMNITETKKEITLGTGEHVDVIVKGVYSLPNGTIVTSCDLDAP